MSPLNWLGAAMIFAAFFALFIVTVIATGWKPALGIWGITLLVVVWITAGSYLLARG